MNKRLTIKEVIDHKWLKGKANSAKEVKKAETKIHKSGSGYVFNIK